MLIREDGHRLPQVCGAAYGRRRTGAAQVGAAYMQLIKGREIRGDGDEKEWN